MAVSVGQQRALLASYLHPQRARVLLLAALVGGSIALQLLNPQILRLFIDRAQAGDALSSLIGAAAVFLGVAFVQQILAVSATYTGRAAFGRPGAARSRRAYVRA